MTSPAYVAVDLTILKLDPAAPDCRLKIGEVRRTMDTLCDQGELTIAEWRLLLERVSSIQAKCH